MYNEQRSWGLFLFRIIEIVFTINIVLLDAYVFRNFVSPATTSHAAIVANTPTPTITEQSTNHTSPTTIINQIAGAKELFIPIGQGGSSGTDWTDISGAQVSIDSAKYTSIKQIVFETSIESPNDQIVYVRLYNQTDNHPVWYSDVSTTTSTQSLTSQPIQLDSGNKLYQVQMKTQLGYTATLTESRLHITLQ